MNDRSQTEQDKVMEGKMPQYNELSVKKMTLQQALEIYKSLTRIVDSGVQRKKRNICHN